MDYIQNLSIYIPVETRRRFNVYKTSIRWNDVVCLLGYCEYELLIKTGLLIKVGISSDRLYRIWFLWLQLWNSSTLTKLLKITLKDDNFFTYVHNVSNITYFCKRSAKSTISRASTFSCDGKIWKRDYSLTFP